MTGDGTNAAPALAQADVGVATNTGPQAAKAAGNMIDLESKPTKLIEIVEIGKQLLITRGALTTFSIANDVAKYFAIITALDAGADDYLTKPFGGGELRARIGVLLRLFLQHRGKVLTHRQLLRDVWGPAHESDTHYLRVHMANLRKKVEATPDPPQFLKTESGIGYRFAE